MPLIRFTDGRSFDPATGEVRAGAAVTRLEPQRAALLTLLVDRAGTVVSHGEIVRHLWPTGTHVDFKAGVHYAVRQVRMAFDERAAEGRVVWVFGARERADDVVVVHWRGRHVVPIDEAIRQVRER